jgi:hypothetical protein
MYFELQDIGFEKLIISITNCVLKNKGIKTVV